MAPPCTYGTFTPRPHIAVEHAAHPDPTLPRMCLVHCGPAGTYTGHWLPTTTFRVNNMRTYHLIVPVSSSDHTVTLVCHTARDSPVPVLLYLVVEPAQFFTWITPRLPSTDPLIRALRSGRLPRGPPPNSCLPCLHALTRGVVRWLQMVRIPGPQAFPLRLGAARTSQQRPPSPDPIPVPDWRPPSPLRARPPCAHSDAHMA